MHNSDGHHLINDAQPLAIKITIDYTLKINMIFISTTLGQRQQ